MSESVLADLFPALNLAVIERLENRAFHFLTPVPSWMAAAFDQASAGGRNTLGGAFPFLEDFLHQADGAWKAGVHASIVSGPFAAVVDGDELLLRATALTAGGRPFLVLERLVGAADTRPVLQKARQHMLEGEQLTRQVSKLHAPLAGLGAAVSALVAADLSAEERALVDRVAGSYQALAAVAAGLPRGDV
jgi:hypothetical protein